MPTYSYRCKQCEAEFDFIQTMADKPLKVVPSTAGPCGQKCKSPVERVLTAPNVNLRQGQTETIESGQATTEKHWDGRQDVTVRPEPVRASIKLGQPG